MLELKSMVYKGRWATLIGIVLSAVVVTYVLQSMFGEGPFDLKAVTSLLGISFLFFLMPSKINVAFKELKIEIED